MPPNFTGSGRSGLPLEQIDWFHFKNDTSQTLSLRLHPRDGEVFHKQLAPRETICFDLLKEKNSIKLLHDGEALSKIDLNDGRSADDLIISSSPWPQDNYIRYKPKFFSLPVSIIDFYKQTYLRAYQDPDGVDGMQNTGFFQSVARNTFEMCLLEIDI